MQKTKSIYEGKLNVINNTERQNVNAVNGLFLNDFVLKQMVGEGNKLIMSAHVFPINNENQDNDSEHAAVGDPTPKDRPCPKSKKRTRMCTS